MNQIMSFFCLWSSSGFSLRSQIQAPLRGFQGYTSLPPLLCLSLSLSSTLLAFSSLNAPQKNWNQRQVHTVPSAWKNRLLDFYLTSFPLSHPQERFFLPPHSSSSGHFASCFSLEPSSQLESSWICFVCVIFLSK